MATSIFYFSHIGFYLFDPLPNDKILDLSKFKTLADDKINENEKLKFVLGMAQNILGKEKILVSGIFSYFQNVFKKFLPQGRCKLGWLVVLRFHATLTAKVISWRSVMHMYFLAFSHQY